MRLADFILANLEPILVDWEAFAHSVWPGGKTDPATLRDHAAQILRATARDMESAQTATQQSDKSKGEGDAGKLSLRMDDVSDVHAVDRARSGFDLPLVVAEYRALRASVIRLWRESAPYPHQHDLQDVIRFNESIDQSLTEAIRSYTQHVDQSRQMFLAILGHDLRNPLTAVIMLANALSRPGQLDAESSAMAGEISTNATAMARMISDLLDFTSAGLGAEMPLSPAPMNLQSLCQEVVDEMRAAHPACTVHYQPHGDLAGNWDAARLRQVVSNLLGNAIQHGSPTEPVDLAVDVEGSNVRLTVRNGGPPIPRDSLPTLFEPLVRVVSPEKPRRPGSLGLGLYIAREVVTAHGGTLHVKSSVETGTVFTVRLPR
jgi:hypothetical protein